MVRTPTERGAHGAQFIPWRKGEAIPAAIRVRSKVTIGGVRVVFKFGAGCKALRPLLNKMNKPGLMFNISFLSAPVPLIVPRSNENVTMKANFSGNRQHGKIESGQLRRLMSALLLTCAFLVGCRTGGEAPANSSISDDKSAAAPSSGAPSYAVDVAPILNRKCVSCHGRFLPQKGLRLHSREAISEGGDNGIVVVPGNPPGSPLYTALNLPTVDPRHMPPVAGGQTLSAAEIATIRDWIAGGAF